MKFIEHRAQGWSYVRPRKRGRLASVDAGPSARCRAGKARLAVRFSLCQTDRFWTDFGPILKRCSEVASARRLRARAGFGTGHFLVAMG